MLDVGREFAMDVDVDWPIHRACVFLGCRRGIIADQGAGFQGFLDAEPALAP